MTASTRLLIVPGWQKEDSDTEHWQSLWAQRFVQAVYVSQHNRTPPLLRTAWVDRLAGAILEQPGPVVLAAHGLGCITATHLPPEAVARIQGALLVAPADPERRGALVDFAPVPYQPLPYRNIVVASSNDPFCPIRLASAFARAWRSELVRLPNAGHIDTASGHGAWPLGEALLQSLAGQQPFATHPRAAAQGAPSGDTPRASKGRDATAHAPQAVLQGA